LAYKHHHHQQNRLYMTDLQKSAVSAQRLPAPVQRTNRPTPSSRPTPGLKAQDRSWAHCERILSKRYWETPSPLFLEWTSAFASGPLCATFKRTSPLAFPRDRIRRIPPGAAGAAVAGSGTVPERDISSANAGAGIHGQSDFTHAERSWA